MEFYKKDDMNYENGHSQFLVKLLQIQNKIFLDSFLEVVESNITFNSDVEITFEEQADTISSKGRVDIFLTDGTNALLIENKINASDQEKQLERYSDWANGQNLNFNFYYLSPYGSDPTKKGLGKLPLDQIKIISYSKHIREWLKKCLDGDNQYKDVIEDYLKQLSYLDKDWSSENKQIYRFFEVLSQRSKELCALQYEDGHVNESHMSSLAKKGKFDLKFSYQDKKVELIYDRNENYIFLRMSADDFKSTMLKIGKWENANDNYDHFVCKVKKINIALSQPAFDIVLSQSIKKINNAFKDNC